jgi:hypothetical protein
MFQLFKGDVVQIIGRDSQTMLMFSSDFGSPSPDTNTGGAQGIKRTDIVVCFDQPVVFQRIS